MTLLIGSEGSMGRRYKAILKYLKEPFDSTDVSTRPPPQPIRAYDRYIIATPTESHHDLVVKLGKESKPILCEKPLSKDLNQVESMLKYAPLLSMQMQYRKLALTGGSGGLSWYDYYNHGKDGLVWDCFQIVALADEQVVLREESPLWNCGVNGQTLRIEAMDMAYVAAVDDWLHGEKIAHHYLRDWHQKVSVFEGKWISNALV